MTMFEKQRQCISEEFVTVIPMPVAVTPGLTQRAQSKIQLSTSGHPSTCYKNLWLSIKAVHNKEGKSNLLFWNVILVLFSDTDRLLNTGCLSVLSCHGQFVWKGQEHALRLHLPFSTIVACWIDVLGSQQGRCTRSHLEKRGYPSENHTHTHTHEFAQSGLQQTPSEKEKKAMENKYSKIAQQCEGMRSERDLQTEKNLTLFDLLNCTISSEFSDICILAFFMTKEWLKYIFYNYFSIKASANHTSCPSKETRHTVGFSKENEFFFKWQNPGH
ncbi:hypothetical protein EK904_013343 [Melospiza melodia maxima]|nr:hypothetical protein EK904_013343 [Melospiza melodia maxima]